MCSIIVYKIRAVRSCDVQTPGSSLYLTSYTTSHIHLLYLVYNKYYLRVVVHMVVYMFECVTYIYKRHIEFSFCIRRWNWERGAASHAYYIYFRLLRAAGLHMHVLCVHIHNVHQSVAAPNSHTHTHKQWS